RLGQKALVGRGFAQLASVERDQGAEPRRADVETRVGPRSAIPNPNRSNQLALLLVPPALVERRLLPPVPARAVIAARLPGMEDADQAGAGIPTMLEEVVESRGRSAMQVLNGESTRGQHAQCVSVHRRLGDV